MIDYSAARKAMVDHQVAVSSVTDPRLLSVLHTVPRELFVSEARRALAYSDAVHPIAEGRYLSAPAPFARLVQLAGIGARDRVLDIGTGTGYSSAVLAGLAYEVVSLENDKALARIASQNLSRVGVTNASVLADEAEALSWGPFDAIIFQGAVKKLPHGYLDRLSQEGRLAAVLGLGRTGMATVWASTGTGVVPRSHFNATLPPLPVAAVPLEFVF